MKYKLTRQLCQDHLTFKSGPRYNGLKCRKKTQFEKTSRYLHKLIKELHTQENFETRY